MTKMTLPVPGLFVPAKFCERLNRFVATIQIEGKVHRAHVPTSGRLRELLVPEAQVLVRKGSGKFRKTQWDLMLVKTMATWVSLDSRLPNYLVGQLLAAGTLPPFGAVGNLRPECSHGAGRLDFCFTDTSGQQTLLEVKSVTLVTDGWAQFPDAPSLRGTRHLTELTTAARQGWRSAVVFVIQRDDATRFGPNWATDPAFASALVLARQAGVEIYAWRCRAAANQLDLLEQVPVSLEESG